VLEQPRAPRPCAVPVVVLIDSDVFFALDGEIRCTLPGEQVVGLTPVVVYTWNAEVYNASSPSGWQASNPFYLPLKCPEDFFGRENEVGGDARWRAWHWSGWAGALCVCSM
jgi:hypothetical protein